MKAKRAFTLIELLVVIAIIALLLSIILPSMKLAKQKTQSTICKSNLRQWFVVFKMYTQENSESFNGGWAGTAVLSNWWMDAGRDYYGNVDKIRCCPRATMVDLNKDGTNGPGNGKEPYRAWGYQPNFFKNPDDYGSYGINGWIENKPDKFTTAANIPKFWRKMTTISSPGMVPLMTDAQWIDGWPEPDNAPPAEENSRWATGGSTMVRFVQNRHHEAQNIVCLDGEASTIGLKQLWTFKWHRDYNISGPWTKSGGAAAASWPLWMRNMKDY